MRQTAGWRSLCAIVSGFQYENRDNVNMPLACGLWFHKQKCLRPREKWQKKDPREKGKRKRSSDPSKPTKKVNGNCDFKTDAQTPASDNSSPATDTADPEEHDTEALPNEDSTPDGTEPQLPPIPHTFRAHSAGPGPRGLQARTRHRASERQVQSSPGQSHEPEVLPIEIDLTPKPVRRQLFPSPDKVQVRSDPGPTMSSTGVPTHLPAFVRRSPRLHKKSRDVFAMSAGAVAVAVGGKENAAPTPAVLDDGLNDLFEEGTADVELPPMTPTPKRRSERLLLKTPSKTPQRQFGNEISSNAEPNPNFRTPRPKQMTHPCLAALLGTTQKAVEEMTPFSRSIHAALTSDHPLDMNFGLPEEYKAIDVKKNTPNKLHAFDFPDLPSLKNSSPMASDQLINFNFSEMTTDQLNSDFNDPFANGVMPSSPPPGLFSHLHDEMGMNIDAIWDNLVDADGAHQSSYPDPEALAVKTASPQGVRRSPRRQQVK